MHFDRKRYTMGDFIIMPNHVHLLSAFASAEMLWTQCASWMRFSARKINQRLGSKGKFWQPEAFDHLVRTVDQYEYLRKYIANNGVKAKLQPSEFLYRKYIET